MREFYHQFHFNAQSRQAFVLDARRSGGPGVINQSLTKDEVVLGKAKNSPFQGTRPPTEKPKMAKCPNVGVEHSFVYLYIYIYLFIYLQACVCVYIYIYIYAIQEGQGKLFGVEERELRKPLQESRNPYVPTVGHGVLYQCELQRKKQTYLAPKWHTKLRADCLNLKAVMPVTAVANPMINKC